METRDKYKDNGISLVQHNLLCWCQEVKRMAENDPELLNAVYREISEKLGMDAAMEHQQRYTLSLVTIIESRLRHSTGQQIL